MGDDDVDEFEEEAEAEKRERKRGGREKKRRAKQLRTSLPSEQGKLMLIRRKAKHR